MQPYMGNFGSRGAFWGSDNPNLPASDTGGAQIIAQNGGVAPTGYVEVGAGTPPANPSLSTNTGNMPNAGPIPYMGGPNNPTVPGATLPGASSFSGQGSGPNQNSAPPSPVLPPNPNGNNMFGQPYAPGSTYTNPIQSDPNRNVFGQPYVGYNIYDPLGQGTGSFGSQQTTGKQQAVAGFGGPYQDPQGPEGGDTYGYTTPQDKVTNALFGLSYGGDHFGFPKGMFNKL